LEFFFIEIGPQFGKLSKEIEFNKVKFETGHEAEKLGLQLGLFMENLFKKERWGQANKAMAKD